MDDQRIVSAIVFVIKSGLRWRDAPRLGPHKTVYNLKPKGRATHFTVPQLEAAISRVRAKRASVWRTGRFHKLSLLPTTIELISKPSCLPS